MRRSVVLAVSLAAPLAALSPTASRGEIYNVNNTQDLPDADQGNPLCAAANGKCTLRAAIM